MSTTHPVIKAQRRTVSGSGAAGKLRRSGLVPAVIYGHSIQAESLQIDEKSLRTILAQHGVGSSFVVDLDIEAGEGKKAEKRLAIVQARQSDPVSKKLLHVDFHGVSADEEIHATLNLDFVGTPAGAKSGGLLNAILHSIEVSAKPDALPEDIKVDVSVLNIGDAIHIGDLKLPAGVKALGEAVTTVVTLVEPRVSEASDEAKEPELVGAKKDESAA
jgi:large subunit ribosomal protein L25